MPEFLPFRGIRYNLDRVGEASRVVAPPYDILNDEGVAALYRKSPYNIIRIDLGKAREDGQGVTEDWHARAGELFRRWRREGILVDEAAPAYYVVRQRYTLPDGSRKELVGLIGCCRLSPFAAGEVLAHEHTFSKPKADRFRLMQETEANISQVYAFYSDPERRVRALIEPVLASPPEASAVDDEGQEHDVWVITDPGIQSAIRDVLARRPFFIADGHHRYETALAYKEERAAALGPDDRAGWNYVMMFVANLDEGGITVLPTHRLIVPLHKAAEAGALREALAGWYEVEEARMGRDEALAFARNAVTEETGRLGVYLGAGRWVWLTPKDKERLIDAVPSDASRAVKGLTVTALHEVVLPKAFGIGRDEQAAGETIEYLRDADAGVARVDRGEAGALIYVPAPGPREILAVASAGDVMPHKSTYFYPKLLTGLVMNDLSRPVDR